MTGAVKTAERKLAEGVMVHAGQPDGGAAGAQDPNLAGMRNLSGSKPLARKDRPADGDVQRSDSYVAEPRIGKH